ncbi:MAG: 5'-nucleotidase C-terminal domain-containing protein [Paludibacteraceae bacterium]|nr:5'-nucleotidase C-terminal domain-containing protein [Paludibacteraceae bacterium]
MKRILILCCSAFLLFACSKKSVTVSNSAVTAITVDARYDNPDNAYHALLAPVKASVDSQMNIVIGHAERNMTGHRPESLLSNWESDAILEIGSEMLGRPADVAIMNMGGIRRDMPAGDITVGRIYELMPFENKVVFIELSGADLDSLCQNFAVAGGQGVAGMSFAISHARATDIRVQGNPIDHERTYTIVTSDYLAGGNDQMEPLQKGVLTKTDNTLRDLFMQKVMRETAAGRNVDAQLDGRIVYYDAASEMRAD